MALALEHGSRTYSAIDLVIALTISLEITLVIALEKMILGYFTLKFSVNTL